MLLCYTPPESGLPEQLSVLTLTPRGMPDLSNGLLEEALIPSRIRLMIPCQWDSQSRTCRILLEDLTYGTAHPLACQEVSGNFCPLV